MAIDNAPELVLYSTAEYGCSPPVSVRLPAVSVPFTASCPTLLYAVLLYGALGPALQKAELPLLVPVGAPL